jgi:ketol-acid reductoisomerase
VGTDKHRYAATRHAIAKGANIKIAIIGAGNVGRALGSACRGRGREVTFGLLRGRA